MVPLPSYAPKLNLQEHLWRWLRLQVTHNHFLGSMGALIAAAKQFFAQLAQQPDQVLQRINIATSPLERQPASLLQDTLG